MRRFPNAAGRPTTWLKCRSPEAGLFGQFAHSGGRPGVKPTTCQGRSAKFGGRFARSAATPSRYSAVAVASSSNRSDSLIEPAGS